MWWKFILLLLWINCICDFTLESQNKFTPDTVVLSLQDAEKLFLENNFDLLASRDQVREADASVIQAKLWDNPSFSIEQGVYNQDTRKWFDFSPTGETALSLQQLITLAGKRNKRISIEKINSRIANFQ